MRLKVCPFCGEKATAITILFDKSNIKFYQVEHYCELFKKHLTTLRYKNKKDVIIAWNQRHEGVCD